MWVAPGHPPLLLDENEYDALDLAHRDPTAHAQIQQALTQLWTQATIGAGPFTACPTS